MPLDPKVQALLAGQRALGKPPLNQLSVAEARHGLASEMAQLNAQTPAIANVRALTIPGPGGELLLRVYTPLGSGPFPILVFIHGGGWVIGDLDTHDHICRYLCAGAGCVVASVDYRLAPEHAFPAASDDCLAAVRWVAEHAAELGGDPDRLAIGGDSAGGNLSASTALRLRDEGGPALRGQLLIYPVTGHYSLGLESYATKGSDYGLTSDSMIWFWDHYLQDPSKAQHSYAAPLVAPDLSGLPPAFVLVAEYDPLHDDVVLYAERLKAAQVPTTYSYYYGVNHGFVNQVGVFDQALEALGEMSTWLRGIFA